MKKYFIDILRRHYADFKGKADRREFWYFVLNSTLIYIVFFMFWFFCFANQRYTKVDAIFALLFVLFSLFLIIPSIAITTRRLHDSDHSGWWQLFYLVCGLVVLVFMLLPSKSPTRFDLDKEASDEKQESINEIIKK